MSLEPNSQKPNASKDSNANPPIPKPNRSPEYPHNEQKNNPWLWLLPLLIITLGVGLLAGRFWGEKNATETLATNEKNEQKSVVPQIATATGVTEVEGSAVATPKKPVLTVEIITPQQAIVQNALSAEGTIAPKDIATVNGKVSGVTIEKVLVEEGDSVSKGQVLAEFDTDAMQQRRIEAQASLVEAQTQLQLAESDANRVLPLLEINAVSEQEADRYVAAANQAAASVAAAKARLSNQNLNLNNAQITAPVAGIISKKTANIGSVPGGQEPLFTIIKDGRLEWQAQVDPSKLGDINVGTPVKVDLPKNNSVMGQVSRIAPVAEKGSRQVSVYATLANNPSVRAGMYQRGTFILGEQGKQVLPMSAIVTQDGYDYVVVVKREKNSDGETIFHVSREKVSLGERKENYVIVTKPLPKNTAIVRQGGSFLNDGDIVRIASPNAPSKNKNAG